MLPRVLPTQPGARVSIKITYANATLLYSDVLVVTQEQQTDRAFSVDSWFCCFVVVINCWLPVGIVRHCVCVWGGGGGHRAVGPIDAKRFYRLMECSYIYKPVPHTLKHLFVSSAASLL